MFEVLYKNNDGRKFRYSSHGSYFIAIKEFLPDRACTDVRISKGYLIAARAVVRAFEKMDLVVYT